jgi:membrane fusion protein (multidrug efflux system)
MHLNKLSAVPASGAALLITALLSACGSHSGGPPGGWGTPGVKVTTLKAQSLNLTRELPGRTSAFLVAEVRPQVTGIVQRRLFTEGGAVTAGQVLYQLDDRSYQAAYDSAAAAFSAAQQSAQRSAELRKIDAVSAQDDEAAAATARQAEAALAAARVNLGYTRITAPISGRIGKSSVTQGALVTANQADALATVQQLDFIYVDVTRSSSEWLELKEDIDAGRLKAGGNGTPVKIVLESGKTYAHEGKLQFADVTVDEQTGSLLLRVLVPNPDHTLLPGMYAKAIIGEGTRTNAVLAPQQAISHDPTGQATALVVGADNKVEPRSVEVSRAIDDQWLVQNGLAAGDRLIVEGLQKVQPGMVVQATEVGSAPPAPPAAPAAGASPAAAK